MSQARARGGPLVQAGSGQGGFHRWFVVDVATVRVRGARIVPHGWALVVEAGQGLEGAVGDEVVVPWEIEPEISSVDLSGGLQGDGEHDNKGAVSVDGSEVWKCG